MSILTPDRAFVEGFYSGLRSIITGRCDIPHRVIRRRVGSPATDRIARYRDMERFRDDVRRGDGLANAYQAVSTEWSSSDDAGLWDTTVGDGLG